MASAQVQLMHAQRRIKQLEQDIWYAKGFTIQQCIDMAQITLNREFGFGPVYNKRFEQRFREVFVEYASLCVEDGDADEELDYTKYKVDQELRVACGDDIIPFDERFALKRMYFRDGRDDWKVGQNGKAKKED